MRSLLTMLTLALTPLLARGQTPRLFGGLGNHHHQVTTKSPQAQRFFDQGLALAYAFNHPEAKRSFEEAARLDLTCAMCHWGIAYVRVLAAQIAIRSGRPADAIVPLTEAMDIEDG